MSSRYQMLVEYVLVYCTATGLTALGEPSVSQDGINDFRSSYVDDGKQPLPVWIVFIFIGLAAAKWLLSFLIQYVYLVILTVTAVASTSISPLAAAAARTHTSSQRAQLDQLILKIRVVGAFKTARARRVEETRLDRTRRLASLSISEVKADLHRRKSIRKHIPAQPKTPIAILWHRITSLPCFRGFAPYVMITISQWILAFITDFILSGHPSDHMMGYGTTSVTLQTVFASAYAVWTHYCITKPSNKQVLDHFPKGGDVLLELWPMTALWAISEHVCRSGPLALSRYMGLKSYAFDASVWTSMSEEQIKQVLGQFAIVATLHFFLALCMALPVTIVIRRVHASMMSDEDVAIVPFDRGDKPPLRYAARALIRKPGVTISKAFHSLTWSVYLRVLGVLVQGFMLRLLVGMIYWTINWQLYEILQVDRYARAKLPWSPAGVFESLAERKFPDLADAGHIEL